MSWKERGVGIVRITFGLVWVVAATLSWLPQFQNTFVARVAVAKAGQPGFIQGWISFWANLVSVNPLVFARILSTTQTLVAVLLILGIFSNMAYIVGIFLSLGIWSIPEGFGGPYLPGHTTDIGTAFPYAHLFFLLLCWTLLWARSVAHFQVGASGLPGFRLFSAKQEAGMSSLFWTC